MNTGKRIEIIFDAVRLMTSIKRIAVLTSGGDSSGMNPCIRSVVRTGIYKGFEVMGVMHGYQGLIDDEFIEMSLSSVRGIINRGGTILRTSRSEGFLTIEGRKKAYDNLVKHSVDALVVIGGDGTFRGAVDLISEFNFPIIGIPGTIDNDIAGTDYTIGYDTAVNVAMEAIDKVRDTALSHERLFIVEVMGRHAGYIAMEAGIASGASEILIPETVTVIDDVVANLERGRKRGRLSNVIVVAEGDDAGGAFDIARLIKGKTSYEVRVVILGHMQRGGSPTAYERLMASRFGYQAIKAIMNGDFSKTVGVSGAKPVLIDLAKAARKPSRIKEDDLDMIIGLAQ